MRTNILIIETTRKCNMNCAHCLRGDAQNKDMPLETLHQIFKIFDDFSEITFTGGEPSLNTNLIQAAIDHIKEKNIPLNSFFIATNGKENVDELLTVCDQLYYICQANQLTDPNGLSKHTEKLKTTIQYLRGPESFFGGLALSTDKYHSPIPYSNIIKLISRSYFSDVKMTDFNEHMPVINRGHATNLPSNETSERTISQLYNDGDDGLDQVYINIHGDILSDCDLDYENQHNHKYGNVFDKDIVRTLQSLAV